MTSRHRWSVCKRDGRWRVLDRGIWSETYDTLAQAHTAATQHAIADCLYQPGGPAYLAELLEDHRKDCTR